MIKCDKNDIPLLVQRIQYLEEPRITCITFFNGSQVHMDSFTLFPRALSDASRPTAQEMEKAYTIFNCTPVGYIYYEGAK